MDIVRPEHQEPTGRVMICPTRGVVVNQRRTDTSKNQESGHEPSKVHRRVARTVHKIIWVCASLADPVGKRRNNVNADHQQRPVPVP